MTYRLGSTFRFLALFTALTALVFQGCEKKKAPEAGPLAVTVTPVLQQDVTETRTWVGLLTGFQNSEIRAQVSGYLLSQVYKEGSDVKTGDILFQIDPRTFQAALAQAQADYAQAVAKAQLSQITLSRQEQLYKTKVISQQEYDTSYQDTQASIAAAAAAQAKMQTAQINVDYCTIRAPFDGIAGVAQAQIGDLVGPGGSATVLTQMSQVNPIKMNFSITEEEYLTAAPLLKKLQAMTEAERLDKLELVLANGQKYDKNGRFDFVNRQVNSATGTIQITGLFPNDDDVLRPGLFGRVTAPIQELIGALLVPQASVVELQGNYYVSFVTADSVVQTFPVKLGPTQGDLQVIMNPKIKAGDKAIVGGVEKAKPGMKVTATAVAAPTPAPADKPKPGV